MSALLGLAFIGGSVALTTHYVRCLLRGEFPGGGRRSYIPISRDCEPIGFWTCAVFFGMSSIFTLVVGVGIGVRGIVENL